MIDRKEWEGHQHFELGWWTENSDTFGEEYKQVHVYAPRMGLGGIQDGGRWPIYQLDGMNLLDVGGGPVSLLLKVRGANRRVVADPCEYPQWTTDRYETAGIEVIRTPGEDLQVLSSIQPGSFDEVWCYNVLQHTMDPERVVANMRSYGKLIRWFEWVNMPPHEGHPHELKWELLSEWLGDGDGWCDEENIYHPATITDDKPWYIGTAFYGYRTT